ncbi:MAG: ABC transporter permease [Burkholderiales bacterium]|nr:ABC transporter permease [Burkholderiales bacterium]
MITVGQRTRHYLKDGRRSLIFVIALYSLSFCVFAQIALGFISFYNSHKEMAGDEISLFTEPDAPKNVQEILLAELQAIVPGTQIKEIDAKDLLDEEILKAVGSKKGLPTVFSVSFPVMTPWTSIEKIVHKVEELKSVSVVSANLEWIKKRGSIRQAVALAVCACGIPACLLVFLVIVAGTTRINNSLKTEQSLLLMLGAEGWNVRGPAVIVSSLAAFISSVIGGILFAITAFSSVPFLESAFEFVLMPPWEALLTVYGILTGMLVFVAAVSSYIQAGRTPPLKL